MTKLKLYYLGHILKSLGSLEQTVMLATTEGSRKRGKLHRRWSDSIEVVIGVRLQEQSRAAEDKALQTPGIHVASRRWSQQKRTEHTTKC